MRVDLNSPILQLDGTEFGDKLTLKSVCFLAVTTPHKDDEGMAVDLRMRLYRLAQRLVAGGISDFDAEDIALLKERIGKTIAPVVIMGRAFDLLEGRNIPSGSKDFQ